ncbi:MAG: ribose 5-phosphate isomerase B [Candidatus Zixiibacteriota bacterium]|nr:MAG: ribose 5-phosphate isomerase B [candidate division Zixibacteria bacterium]
MKIALGSDHRGFCYKHRIKAYLSQKGIEVIDCGADSEKSVDYSEFGLKAAGEVARGNADYAILVCGTGNGMLMAANKVKSIRAGLAVNPEMAALTRAHNDANVLVLSDMYTPCDQLNEIVDKFLETEFEGGRHKRRVDIITEYEDKSDV